MAITRQHSIVFAEIARVINKNNRNAGIAQ